MTTRQMFGRSLSLRLLVASLCLANAGACSWDWERFSGSDARIAHDSAPPRETDGRGAAADGPARPCSWDEPFDFDPPVALTTINSPDDEGEPFVTADGLTIYFSALDGPSTDAFSATRRARTEAFGNRTKQALSGAEDETHFALSHDGLTAYFSTFWPGGKGDADIWTATRPTPEQPFKREDFRPLSGVNGSGSEFDPFITHDNLRLYFSSWRGKSRDILYVERTSAAAAFGPEQTLEGISTPDVDEDNPTLTADERVIVFGAKGADDPHDLYYAVRAQRDATFSARRKVPSVNTTGFESQVHVTPDGCELYFASDRPGGKGGHDLYHARYRR